MRKPFYEAFGELTDLLEPGQVIDHIGEACIFYGLVPKYYGIMVKFENEGYRCLRGDEVVKVILGASPHYLPDEAELTLWRKSAHVWLNRLELQEVETLLYNEMWHELSVMTGGKL